MKQIDFSNRKLLDICQSNDVSFLGLFGSFSRGDATEESDADLGLAAKVRMRTAKTRLIKQGEQL